MDKRWKELFGHYPADTLRKFKAYHQENPLVFKHFKRLAFEAIGAGRQYYSSKMVINILRWETEVRGYGDFKINDKYQSLYGRLFIYEFPEFKNLFQIRIRKR